MQSILILLIGVLGSVSAHGFGNRCNDKIHFVPHYITHYEKVPHYNTVYKEVAVASPVPKVIYETKFVDHYVTKTAFKPVYKTVYDPVYVTQVFNEKIFKTKFATKFVPQYVTQTEYQPQFMTHTVDQTQTIPVPEKVTVCPVHAGSGGGYGGGAKQVAAHAGYGDY